MVTLYNERKYVVNPSCLRKSEQIESQFFSIFNHSFFVLADIYIAKLQSIISNNMTNLTHYTTQGISCKVYLFYDKVMTYALC